ncbi:hypothetical protein [Symbiopectobacterium sp. RP]|uniref:hypothetical protein n=1 Tax=Symbiopectobacterium sp. RP TaxID=3248553 RepID=UPI003D284F4E
MIIANALICGKKIQLIVIKIKSLGYIGPLTQLHQALSRPYDEQPEYESLAAVPPAWGKALEVSCSN